jgi:hypothetical protein
VFELCVNEMCNRCVLRIMQHYGERDVRFIFSLDFSSDRIPLIQILMTLTMLTFDFIICLRWSFRDMPSVHVLKRLLHVVRCTFYDDEKSPDVDAKTAKLSCDFSFLPKLLKQSRRSASPCNLSPISRSSDAHQQFLSCEPVDLDVQFTPRLLALPL